MDLTETECEYGTGSGLYPMVGFGISNAKLSENLLVCQSVV
jgi:hypothetical protein